ncbi:hypothetical protein RGAI101_4003 [Roseobacter sp. GAI101]|nr:hypothetical protein RGAI101_4003 [Roseobacter sp. GAI101]
MDHQRRANLQKIKSGGVVPRHSKGPRGECRAQYLRQHVATLGPKPKKSLEAFVDLGLTDGEIARYFNMPKTCISKLCHLWGIR